MEKALSTKNVTHAFIRSNFLSHASRLSRKPHTSEHCLKSYLSSSKHQISQSSKGCSKQIRPRKHSMVTSHSMGPHQVLDLYKESLTVFEESEIHEYPDIFYFGQNALKRPHVSSDRNSGYDDDSGNYRAVKSDHIAYRYEIWHLLGKGSFGQVFQCFDHKRKEQVAIKIVKNKPRFHSQATTEIKILQRLRDADPDDKRHIINMKNYFLFRKHVCIVFELLPLNLYEFLKKNRLDLNVIRKIAHQLLISLDYLNKNSVIHCDLKPENVMVKGSNVKVIDLGSACFSRDRIYTYIQSRFYRAPEVMLGVPYTSAIDMWSFGCILFELYTGCALFPGENEQDQMARILEVKGNPPLSLLYTATRKHLFFDGDTPKVYTSKKGVVRSPGTRNIELMLNCYDRAFVDLISLCLDWDPYIRITPTQALRHSFFSEFRKSTSSNKIARI